MSIADPIRATLAMVEALEALGIPCLVGGSLASSLHGIPRATRDADVVADIRPGDVDRLARVLERSFSVDVESIREAVRLRSSFNVLHEETMFKVDVFPVRDALDRSEMERRTPHELAEGRLVPVSTPEDTVLQKLVWYRRGGGTSDRQWNDVLGVLKVQAAGLDLGYLRSWAQKVGVSDLLERAFGEAAPSPE